MKKVQLQKLRKSNIDQVQVYCRIKSLKNSNNLSECINILSPTLLNVNLSENNRGPREINYVFQQIFSSNNSQQEIFDTVALPLINNLINGENGLLFSYGITGSGKTFTMNGDKTNPGIIPRVINVIFNSIEPFQAPKCTFKSDHQNGFLIQDENCAIIDLLNEHRSKVDNKIDSESDIPCLLNDICKVTNINENNLFAVFVSYIEIYNNFIVDLLDDSGKLLRLREVYSNVFIDEMKEVEVHSNEEAFELFNFGQKRKRMGITILNKESSRSHSIFIIKLVQAPVDKCNERIISDNSRIIISQFSLVDLAGSERQSKTQNVGQSLAEACNINNSLMFLRNCLQSLRENQIKGLNTKIQYRNCKLTHLFKNYFDGNGLIRVIICITPEIDDFHETIHILEFAEMAQDIQTVKQYTNTKPGKKVNQELQENNLISDLLSPFTFNSTSESLIFSQNLINHLEVRIERNKLLIDEYNEKSLKFRYNLISIEKENVLKNFEISNLKSTNENTMSQFKNLEKRNLEFEQKIKDLTNSHIKKDKTIQTLTETINDKECEMNQLLIDQKKNSEKLKDESEKLNFKFEKKIEAEKQRIKLEYEQQIHKLNMVRQILDQSSPPLLNRIDSNETKYSTKVDESEKPAPGSVKRLIEQTQLRETMNSVAKRYRRRRSRSCGGRWIEHKPIQTPVNKTTLLKPVAKVTKSVTKLKNIRDVTNSKTSRYFLRSEEEEHNGNVSTKFYKGDVIPTINGGAQVIFDDIEVLKQESPLIK